MSAVDPEEQKAIRAMADVVREKEAGRLTADEAVRRIWEIATEEEARALAKQEAKR